MRTTLLAIAALALCVTGAVGAREIQDGKLLVRAAKDGKYQVDAAVLGKAEFFGYVGDYVADKKITGILLRGGGKASNEQKHIIAITAQAQHIDAFVEVDGKESPLVDPTPATVAAPPPVDDAKTVVPTETHSG